MRYLEDRAASAQPMAGAQPRGPEVRARPSAEGLLLCLRPAFAFVCETIAFAQGGRGDLFHLAEVVGTATMWFLVILCNGLSVYVISSTLSHTNQAPQPH